MPTTFILSRHGHNFDPTDITLRMGSQTDLSLSSTGRDAADALGRTLASRGFAPPSAVYVSPLIRTQETATRALTSAGVTNPPALQILSEFNEINYGEDDGKPEEALIARIGKDAIDAWERNGIMPPEWSPKPDVIIQHLRAVFTRLAAANTPDQHQTDWGFSSGGIIRFLSDPRLADIIEWAIPRPDKIKVAPAHFAHLEYNGHKWAIKEWNVKPS